MQMRLVEPFLLVTSWFPSLTPAVMDLVFTRFNLLPAYTQVGASYEVLVPKPYYPGNEQTEIGIPVEHCGAGLKQLKALIETKNVPANLITEVWLMCQLIIYHSYSCYFLVAL